MTLRSLPEMPNPDFFTRSFAGTTLRFCVQRRMYNRAEPLPGLLPLLLTEALSRWLGAGLRKLSI